MTLTVGSLFSGIGGFDLGFERAGMEIRWQVEIDKQARSVSRRHWPNVTQHEDVRNVGIANLEPVDVVCGGFPCQDLSVAGRRAGLAGKRSGLFWELCRIVEELRPRWVVLENVPGLLSSNGGRDMGTVLGALGDLGHGFAYRVLDAQYFGLAQRRKRVFIVASPGNGTGPAQILFEPDSVSWDSPPRRETGTDLARALTGNTGGCSGKEQQMTFVPAVSPAIKARDHKGLSSDGDGDGASLVAHSLRAEGFDASEDGTGRGTPIVVDSEPETLHSKGFRQGGNHAESQKSHATSSLSVLRKEIGEEAFTQWGLGVLDSLQPQKVLRSTVLREREYRTKEADPKVVIGAQAGAKTMSSGSVLQMRQDQCDGCPPHQRGLERSENRESRTHLSLMSQSKAQAESVLHDLWQASEGIGILRKALSAFQEMGRPENRQAQPTHKTFGVRRLTPREAERLQGFPDDWTRYADDGRELADGPRYRMCGNAVAVPCSEWIGRRIVTLDGTARFPMPGENANVNAPGFPVALANAAGVENPRKGATPNT